MKLSKNIITLLSLASAAPGLASSDARSWKTPLGEISAVGSTLERCRLKEDDKFRDYLGSVESGKEPAEKRIKWAYDCGHIKETNLTKKLWTHTMDPESAEWVPITNGQIKYPTFAYNKPNEGFPLWKPNLDSCDMPEDVIWLGVCVIGCYESSQRIAFSDGTMAIKDAEKARKSKILTIDAGSTFDEIFYKEVDIGYFSKDAQDQDQVLVTFEMASGGSLVVTTNHPLVDSKGRVKEASLFAVGDHLVKQDGSLDEILRRVEKKTFTTVYNVAPTSNQALDNVVIAEGYLNGSAKYQNKQIRDFERLMMRSTLPERW